MNTTLSQTDKNLSRAIAKTVMRYRKDTCTLLKKYYPVEPNMTHYVVLDKVLTGLSTNEKFATEFTDLMQRKGMINMSGPQHRNFAAIIGTIVGAVANVASGIIKNKKEKDAAEDQQTQELLKALEEEKKAQAKQKAMTTLIAVVSVLAFAGIATVLIMKRKK